MVARTGRMSSSSTVYLNDVAALEAFQHNLKLRACPSCAQTGHLIFHGPLVGYASGGSQRQKRGQRVFCSNRFRKRGCGKTFSVLFSLLLKARIIPAGLVAIFLATVMTGSCRQAAWLSLRHGFSLESGYRIWREWVSGQAYLRTWLCRKIPPPRPEQIGDGLAQTWAHLRCAFAGQPCPVAAFQEHFQQPFFPN
jgi:hypothetical protein